MLLLRGVKEASGSEENVVKCWKQKREAHTLKVQVGATSHGTQGPLEAEKGEGINSSLSHT